MSATSSATARSATTPLVPRWLRLLVVSACCAVLSACRAPQAAMPAGGDCPPGADYAMMAGPLPPPYPVQIAPHPYQVNGSWAPPGIATPWPQDEYLRDGGDYSSPVAIAPDWEVNGLEQEDAVAHFDTLDGRTLVEPSNRVHLYAPRFGAVRRVSAVESSSQTDEPVGLRKPLQVAQHDNLDIPTSSLQREELRGQAGLGSPTAYEGSQLTGDVSITLRADAFQDRFLPFEDFLLIRRGLLNQTENARLAEMALAAVVWAKDEGVKVILDGQMATEAVLDREAQGLHTYHDPRNNPRLRLIKVASTPFAKPGETVDFTLRLDNVGDQVLGNVVVLDNLSTRLEYVADTSQASVGVDFSTEVNDGESLILRWELTEPLEPGAGAVLRFQCRVR